MNTTKSKAIQVGDRVELTKAAKARAWTMGVPGFDQNVGTIRAISNGEANIDWDTPFGRGACKQGTHSVKNLRKIK